MSSTKTNNTKIPKAAPPAPAAPAAPAPAAPRVVDDPVVPQRCQHPRLPNPSRILQRAVPVPVRSPAPACHQLQAQRVLAVIATCPCREPCIHRESPLRHYPTALRPRP